MRTIFEKKAEPTPYEVSAKILMYFLPGYNPHQMWMYSAVQHAVTRFPWRDKGPASSDPAGVLQPPEENRPRNQEFVFTPRSLGKSQIYAYEKYVVTLAKEIAKNLPQGISEVRYEFKVHRVGSFQADEGIINPTPAPCATAWGGLLLTIKIQ